MTSRLHFKKLLSFLLVSLSHLSLCPVAAQESTLPILSIESKQPIVPEPAVPMVTKVIGAKDFNPTIPLPGTVKIRGATSQAYPKKSFALTLTNPIAFFGMRTSAHWVLNAAYIDRSLMRHKLSYDLFRALSTSSASRFAAASRFVEVRVNGNYQGASLLMERVDRELLRLPAFKSNDLNNACIYKAVDHAANFSQPGHGGYEQREPDPLVTAYWQPLDELNHFVSSSTEPEFFHAQTGIQSRLDLDNTIDFHLLVLLTSNMDGITKNFLLARHPQLPGKTEPRFFFVPWDYDATFGRNWNGDRVDPTAWLSNRLFDRLMANENYRGRFIRRWKQLRDGPFSIKAIHLMMDTNVQALGKAVERNAEKWPTIGGAWYPDKLTFAEDLKQMKAWTGARVDWLDQEINRRAK